MFWACHALHAQKFWGVIGACLAKKYIISNALLGRQSEHVSVQFRVCHLRHVFRARCRTAPSSAHPEGARRYEAWGPFFRRVPTNKVPDAIMRGRHLCGMGTTTATCINQTGKTQKCSSTGAPMRTLNTTHRAPARTRPTAVMDGAPATSYAPPERGGRPIRHGWRRSPSKRRWSSRRRGRPRGHDRE